MKNSNKGRHGLTSLTKGLMIGGLSLSISVVSHSVLAEESEIEEVTVTGIRGSLANALDQKRNADNLIEVIKSEDIGKLPDQNLAEVLENITGVQITRQAGVGTGVQIRGTNANRVEINGVSTVGSGSGRSGIDFEDVNASIISAVEVVKAPDAKTIEGSVGGTVNLRTIRPLELTDMLANFRVQGEDSSLSTEDITPRYSGAFGNTWDTDLGRFGFVISGSYTEQEAVSFRPRTDRDNLASPAGANPAEFLGIQFLVQEQENDDYETTNIATTFEWEPADNLKFYLDVIINEQERSRDQYRLQASGVSSFRQSSIPTAFETVDFGVGLGVTPAALQGTLARRTPADDNGNLRFTSETNARVTDNEIFAIGGEWQHEKWSTKFEYSTSRSETATPNLSTTLNFINPNANLVARVQTAGDNSTRTNVPLINGVTTVADAIATVPGTDTGFIYNDNSTPFIYDLSGGSLSFGIDFGSDYAPTTAQLLDPANVVLDQVVVERNTTDNYEDAFRIDVTYDLDWNAITTIDFGYRYNESNSTFEDIGDNIGGFSRLQDSPNGTLFSELLVQGATNYDDADGRDLFIRNFLLIDPDRSFSDPEGTIAILQAAVVAHDPGSPDILNVRSDQNSFFDVTEETSALYFQANFEYEIFRGNFGLRYIDTDIDSVAFAPSIGGAARSLQSTKGDYSFVLPRINVVAQIHEDWLVRVGWGKDVRRPNFSDLNTGFSFDSSENASVSLGNPGLEPEEVDSFDISAEWYFAPAAVASIGYFKKDRTNIFGQNFQGALLIADPTTVAGFARETDPTCPGGGIFNPEVVPNQLGDPTQNGLCVDFTQPDNDSGETTQEGIELAFQYDLSSFEDRLGWASGFGIIANYTDQEFSGGDTIDSTSGRGLTVLGPVSIPRGLLDFSEKAYNFTVFYEKHGVSARMRYTWREAFRTNDFAGGANSSGSSTFSFPVVTDDRGQLNASVNYAVNEHLNLGVEAVNITEEEIEQNCVSGSGPLCFVGFPDRRITFGASYRF